MLVLSSNVVGVGEERLSLRNSGGADLQDHLKGTTKLYTRRDRDSKAAGTTLVCHCRCSAVPGSMLLQTGGAGFDGAGGEGPLVACSTGSKPGGNDGGTGIRTRGPGTAAGLRFSRPPQ